MSETSSSTADYVLIGGGLANATAAKTIREKDPNGRIVIVAAEPVPPYHRPPLSKEYLRGEADLSEAWVAPETEYAEKKIELKTSVRATALDTTTHTVTLDNGETLTYKRLCLATGATPKRLSPEEVPGADAPNVYYLRTQADSEAIKKHLTPGARCVLIGAGYIGMEVAAGCSLKGVDATVIGNTPQPWGKFASPAFGAFLRHYYEMRGVHFRMNDGVTAITTGADGQAQAVVTKSGETIPCDFVVVGIGVSLNLDLAKAAGLEIDEKDGVLVNSQLKTSAPDVWAAGDIAAFEDPVLGKTWHVEHWQNAEWHGQIAGTNMAGGNTAYDHVPYFFSDEFDLHMLLRGDPQAGKTSFAIGSMEADTDRFLELYLREDGTLAMGILISHEMDETPTSDLLESLIRTRENVGLHQAALISGEKKLEDLLPPRP